LRSDRHPRRQGTFNAQQDFREIPRCFVRQPAQRVINQTPPADIQRPRDIRINALLSRFGPGGFSGKKSVDSNMFIS
jgi:hypothetical protein